MGGCIGVKEEQKSCRLRLGMWSVRFTLSVVAFSPFLLACLSLLAESSSIVEDQQRAIRTADPAALLVLY